jgi:hypothetical protein
MKKEIENLAKQTVSDLSNKPISRKEAIRKTGYFAVSAATLMILLGTPKSASASPAPPPSEAPRRNNDNTNRGPWKK